jgi:hypothetical protein
LNAWTSLYKTWYISWQLSPSQRRLYKSLPSVCVCMCIPLIVVRQRFGRHITAATNTGNRRFVGGVVLYAIRAVSKESLWTCLCIPQSLLGNESVNTFPRQRRIVGSVVLHHIHVLSKEIRLLVLPRTSFLHTSPKSGALSVRLSHDPTRNMDIVDTNWPVSWISTWRSCHCVRLKWKCNRLLMWIAHIVDW